MQKISSSYDLWSDLYLRIYILGGKNLSPLNPITSVRAVNANTGISSVIIDEFINGKFREDHYRSLPMLREDY